MKAEALNCVATFGWGMLAGAVLMLLGLYVLAECLGANAPFGDSRLGRLVAFLRGLGLPKRAGKPAHSCPILVDLHPAAERLHGALGAGNEAAERAALAGLRRAYGTPVLCLWLRLWARRYADLAAAEKGRKTVAEILAERDRPLPAPDPAQGTEG